MTQHEPRPTKPDENVFRIKNLIYDVLEHLRNRSNGAYEDEIFRVAYNTNRNLEITLKPMNMVVFCIDNGRQVTTHRRGHWEKCFLTYREKIKAIEEAEHNAHFGPIDDAKYFK